MIAAASQSLAGLLAHGLAQISRDQISFVHPRMWQGSKPGLNLYCYHVQEVELMQGSAHRWFNLTFLISVVDHTSLGEQNLLSQVLVMLSQYQRLPASLLDDPLQGYGSIQMRIFTQSPAESILFWNVLCTPLKLALHVTLTVPYLPDQALLTL